MFSWTLKARVSSLSIGVPVRLPVDRAPSKDERERIQLDRGPADTHYDELTSLVNLECDGYGQLDVLVAKFTNCPICLPIVNAFP